MMCLTQSSSPFIHDWSFSGTPIHSPSSSFIVCQALDQSGEYIENVPLE